MFVPEKKELPVTAPRKRRLFQDYVNGIMLSVVGLLVVAMFMTYLTNITFQTQIDVKEIGIQAGFMYICTVSANLILRTISRRKGRETEAWIKARETIETNARKITDNGYNRLISPYCRAWEEDEQNTERARILSEIGMNVSEFTGYSIFSRKELKKKGLTKRQISVILGARKVKRLRYKDSYLTASDRGAKREAPSGGITTRGLNAIQTIQYLVATAITTLFSVSIVSELIIDFSYANVVMCLIKFATFAVGAAVGIVGGYNLTTVKEVEEMNYRAAEQSRFIAYCEKCEKKADA